MSQKEQFEFTCIRCSHTSIFETEPPEGHLCQICKFVPPSKEHDSRFKKNYKIELTPSYWRCGNHHQTFKWNDSCPECLEKSTKRNFPSADWIMLPDINDKQIQSEIEVSKTGTMMRNKVKENLIALQQAQLETPNLLKQQLKQQGQILKVLKQLNKNLEVKNEVQS